MSADGTSRFLEDPNAVPRHGGDTEAVTGWPGQGDRVGRMAPLPFLILWPVHHKSTNLP